MTDMSEEEREAETGQLLYDLSKLPWEESGAHLDKYLTAHAEQARREGLEDAALHVYHQWNDYKGPDDMAEGIRALKEGNDEK